MAIWSWEASARRYAQHMNPMIASASPVEIAALWRLNWLSGDDVAAICMGWLEQDIDRGDNEQRAAEHGEQHFHGRGFLGKAESG